MMVSRSERRNRERPRYGEDEIVVTGKSLFGQLIVTDAWYGATRIRVVIDTGAQISMGNTALLKKLGLRHVALDTIQITRRHRRADERRLCAGAADPGRRKSHSTTCRSPSPTSPRSRISG
ncbi:MAG: hypothetical protein WDN44_09755 [Sphingomonas sp.]